MLHILLLILKVIGIIFAVILGILVLLACVVLYVPVRYELTASCDGTFAGIHAKARATWLLHLVGIYVCYEDKELSWRIRIAWKSIKSSQEEKKTIKTEVKTYDEEVEELREGVDEDLEEESGERVEEKPEEIREALEKVGEGSAEDLEEDRESSAKDPEKVGEESAEALEKDRKKSAEDLEKVRKESPEALEKVRKESVEALEERERSSGEGSQRKLKEDSSDEELLEEAAESGTEVEEAEADFGKELKETEIDSGTELKEGESGFEKELEEDDGSGEEERESVWRKVKGICQKIWQKVTGLYQKLASFPEKAKDIAQNTGDKIRILSEKKDKILALLMDEVHKKAFLKVLDEAWRLLRKLKPKKIQAEVHYGFDDPSLTGKILAGISVAYPFLGDDVRVYPDFEQKVLDGHLKITGKLRTSYFVWLLWKLVWCREVRMTYRHIRKFKL